MRSFHCALRCAGFASCGPRNSSGWSIHSQPQQSTKQTHNISTCIIRYVVLFWIKKVNWTSTKSKKKQNGNSPFIVIKSSLFTFVSLFSNERPSATDIYNGTFYMLTLVAEFNTTRDTILQKEILICPFRFLLISEQSLQEHWRK